MPDSRISTKSGGNVEIIHTNGDSYGFMDPIGHIDFYPNGGSSQVGCNLFGDVCSHARAVEYYAESVNNDKFIGYKCENQLENCNGNSARMGGVKDKIEGSGSYSLNTNSNPPFAQE